MTILLHIFNIAERSFIGSLPCKLLYQKLEFIFMYDMSMTVLKCCHFYLCNELLKVVLLTIVLRCHELIVVVTILQI